VGVAVIGAWFAVVTQASEYGSGAPAFVGPFAERLMHAIGDRDRLRDARRDGAHHGVTRHDGAGLGADAVYAGRGGESLFTPCHKNARMHSLMSVHGSHNTKTTELSISNEHWARAGLRKSQFHVPQALFRKAASLREGLNPRPLSSEWVTLGNNLRNPAAYLCVSQRIDHSACRSHLLMAFF